MCFLGIIDCSEFFDPHKVILPQSEAKIVEIVEAAASKKKQVRVVGSGHSRNALAYSEDIILSLEHYKGVVYLDEQAQQVRATIVQCISADHSSKP